MSNTTHSIKGRLIKARVDAESGSELKGTLRLAIDEIERLQMASDAARVLLESAIDRLKA